MKLFKNHKDILAKRAKLDISPLLAFLDKWKIEEWHINNEEQEDTNIINFTRDLKIVEKFSHSSEFEINQTFSIHPIRRIQTKHSVIV